MNPLKKFKTWYKEETDKSSSSIPSACCLTSIGLDGYPNSRFVSLKEVIGSHFVVTGSMTSRKGIELRSNPKTSLTFWWTATERQIRIQGDAQQIEDELANTYFKSRSKASQIVSQISKQGHKTENLSELMTRFEKKKAAYKNVEIDRPNDWSGFYIIPKRIEFMEFKKSRFHIRELFTNDNNHWDKVVLEP